MDQTQNPDDSYSFEPYSSYTTDEYRSENTQIENNESEPPKTSSPIQEDSNTNKDDVPLLKDIESEKSAATAYTDPDPPYTVEVTPPHHTIHIADDNFSTQGIPDYNPPHPMELSPPPFLGTIGNNQFSISASDLRRRRRSKTNDGIYQPQYYTTPHPTPCNHSDSGSSSTPEDIMKQLKGLLLMHKKSALAHTVASRTYRTLHRRYTFGIMLINTIGVIMQQILQGSNASETIVSIFNSTMFSLVGGLTSINNFLGFGSLEMKHLSMRNEHNAIHNLIADAMAISKERNINVNVNWQDILEDVREKERSLAENSVQIPQDILAKFMNMTEEELKTQALG